MALIGLTTGVAEAARPRGVVIQPDVSAAVRARTGTMLLDQRSHVISGVHNAAVEAAVAGMMLDLRTHTIDGVVNETGPAPLKYAPPEGWEEYTVINVPASGTGTNGRFFPSLNAGTDYQFVFPSEPRTGVVRIEGARNVVIRGGETQRAVESGGFQDQDRRCLYFVNVTGDIFIEGMYIHANSNGDPYDGIYVVNNTEVATTITIQNTRIEGVTGSSAGFHGDAFQMQDSSEFNGTIRWYRCTVTTNYQGYYALHEGTDTVSQFEDVNYDITSKNGACLWFGDHLQEYWSHRYTELGPGVYLDPADSGGDTMFDQVRPNDVSPDVSERPVLNAGVMTWPNSDYITGELLEGDPPDGDFVPAENVGIGYESPGYAEG